MRVLLKRILCATDFSDFSNHAIPALPGEVQSQTLRVHVIDLLRCDLEEAVFALEEQQSRMTSYAHKEMTRLMVRSPG
jgi:hypothetical protein